MAIKCQTFKKYSSKLNAQILKEYFDEGKSPSYLSSKYGISKYTITGWNWKTRKGLNIKVDHRPGRSGRIKEKNLTLEDYKERYEILKKFQAFLQARQKKK